ncbi:hypothetical protein MPSEU_001078400 [Mayamaea pseudoterrestris]|nr:hypothetical protein MPSEU_001078400 [Mayamaea pseudoterrestris]
MALQSPSSSRQSRRHLHSKSNHATRETAKKPCLGVCGMTLIVALTMLLVKQQQSVYHNLQYAARLDVQHPIHYLQKLQANAMSNATSSKHAIASRHEEAIAMDDDDNAAIESDDNDDEEEEGDDDDDEEQDDELDDDESFSIDQADEETLLKDKIHDPKRVLRLPQSDLEWNAAAQTSQIAKEDATPEGADPFQRQLPPHLRTPPRNEMQHKAWLLERMRRRRREMPRKKAPIPYIEYGASYNASSVSVGVAVNATHPNCLIVYHVPKTGGLTLGEYVKLFARSMKWTFHHWYAYYNHFQDTAISKHPFPFRNHSVVHMGHMTRQFERETQTQHCTKMTLLREPVDRVISAFYYHGHNDSDWQACLSVNASKSCRLWWEYSNDVTRRFTTNHETWNSYVTLKYLSNDPLTSRSLQEAQESLQQFDFVCFIDNMRDCILRLGQHYGVHLHLPAAELVYNVNARRNNVTDEWKERIAAHNYMDVALYEWAQSQFSG